MKSICQHPRPTKSGLLQTFALLRNSLLHNMLAEQPQPISTHQLCPTFSDSPAKANDMAGASQQEATLTSTSAAEVPREMVAQALFQSLTQHQELASDSASENSIFSDQIFRQQPADFMEMTT